MYQGAELLYGNVLTLQFSLASHQNESDMKFGQIRIDDNSEYQWLTRHSSTPIDIKIS